MTPAAMPGNLVAVSIYKTPEWKVVKVDGWYPREQALESIDRARRRWRAAQAS